MANDRLCLECKCGERKLIAKWWGDMWEAWFDDFSYWMNEHTACDGMWPDEENGKPKFKLKMENE